MGKSKLSEIIREYGIEKGRQEKCQKRKLQKDHEQFIAKPQVSCERINQIEKQLKKN